MTAINQFHKFLHLLILGLLITSTAPLLAGVIFSAVNTADKGQALAIQGGLLIGNTEPDNRIWLDGREVRVDKNGTFIIGFGRDATKAELQINLANGEQQTRYIDVLPREYKIQRIDGLPPAKVNPKGQAVLKRIAEESALVKAARTRDDNRTDFNSGFIWPAKGSISGVYGSQRILNGQPKWPHFGVDIAAATGEPVVAPAAGLVTLAHTDMYYSGGTLIIDHGFGLSSTFLHLSEILVSKGQYVEQGSLVAKIGATGRATGPHLDWRVNWFDVRLDAQRLVAGKPADKLQK